MTPCAFCESPLDPDASGPRGESIPYVFCSVTCAEAYIRAVSYMEASA